MILLSLPSLLISLVFGQNNNIWGCNHFSVIPTDLCVGFSSYTTFKYTCIDSSTMLWESYDTYYDCIYENDPTFSLDIDLNNSTWSQESECHNSDPCETYYELECDHVSSIYPVDICYSLTPTLSHYYTCGDGTKVNATVYSTSNCTGDGITTIYDYSGFIYNSSCYTVK